MGKIKKLIPKTRPRLNQSGLVSFVVVVVVMLVLTLIVMSYARIVRREQTQTLDRQLNSQALYAAESAVNDAMAYLVANPEEDGFDGSKCSGDDSFMDVAGLEGDSDLGSGISYSCLLVNKAPLKLELPGVTMSQSLATRIAPESGSIDTIEISWRGPEEGHTEVSSCPSAGVFPQQLEDECQLGMVRFEFVEFGSSSNRNSLLNSRLVGFLQPGSGSTGASASSFRGDDQGTPMIASCSDGECKFSITGLSSSNGYLRLKSLYRNTPITIQAKNGSGDYVGLVGSQVEIDATGRASGVVKRIKVNKQIPSEFDNIPAPEFAIQTTQSLCKRFTYHSGEVSVPNMGGLDADICDPTD